MVASAQHPLPSWNDGPAKQAIPARKGRPPFHESAETRFEPHKNKSWSVQVELE
jgi:hypothetical protein